MIGITCKFALSVRFFLGFKSASFWQTI